MTTKNIKELEDLYEEVALTLQMHGYSVEWISYPEPPEKRSIDVLAKGEKGNIFVKIVLDASEMGQRETTELKGLSRILEAKPIIVARSEKGEKLEDIVAYERHGVYAVSPEGLSAALRNCIYVIKRHGNLYMRVDSEKLREFREAMGMSLGDLARLLGVSRRSVYEYERSNMDISLSTALKLLELAGEEVFKPIPVLEEPKRDTTTSRRRTVADTTVERRVIVQLEQRGAEIVHTKYTPVDVGARIGNRKAIIIVEHGKDLNIHIKGEEALKIANASVAEKIAIVQHSSVRKDLEALGYNVVRTPSDVVSLVIEEK